MRALISINANELARKYRRRALRAKRVRTANRGFALYLHEFRKSYIQKNIYNRSPYANHPNKKKRLTGNLLKGEKYKFNDAEHSADVFNDAKALRGKKIKYGTIRAKMKGTYRKYPGLSKEADFIEECWKIAVRETRHKTMTWNKQILDE